MRKSVEQRPELRCNHVGLATSVGLADVGDSAVVELGKVQHPDNAASWPASILPTTRSKSSSTPQGKPGVLTDDSVSLLPGHHTSL